MGPRWLPGFRPTAADADAPTVSEQPAFDALDQALTAFASDPEPFDAAATWENVEARMSEPSRASGRLPWFPRWSLPRRAASTRRVAVGALAVAALIAAVTVLSVVLTGDDVARAEFFDAVETLEDLSIDALADGQISQAEAATLHAQAAVVEQTFEADPEAVATSAADATSNAITALTEVRARLLERSDVTADAAGPTANAVVVLERVTSKLEASRGGRGQGQGNQGQGQGAAGADERGRGQGNQGQGVGNAPATEGSNAAIDDEDGGAARPGRGRGGQP